MKTNTTADTLCNVSNQTAAAVNALRKLNEAAAAVSAACVAIYGNTLADAHFDKYVEAEAAARKYLCDLIGQSVDLQLGTFPEENKI